MYWEVLPTQIMKPSRLLLEKTASELRAKIVKRD